MTLYTINNLEINLPFSVGNSKQETYTISANQNIPIGTPLGMVTSTGKLIPSVATASDGSQNPIGISMFAINITADTDCQIIVKADTVDYALLNLTGLSWTPETLKRAFAETNIHIKNLPSSKGSNDDDPIVIVPTVPNAPVLNTPTFTATTLSLSWSTPSNGGSAITDYIVEYKASSSGTWIVFSDGTNTNTSVIITGLTSNTSYDARVRAVNAIGNSPYSNIQTITIGSSATVPDAPVLSTPTTTTTTANLSWTAPSNGGSAITDYIVQYKLSSSGTWLTFSDGTGTGTTAIVTGLTDNTSYDFSVIAVNAIGQSARSNMQTISTQSSVVSPPINTILPLLTFADSFVGTVASTNNGTWTNSPTSYTYQWRRNGTNISGATTNTYTLAPDDIGTAITCRVTAINGIGSTGATSSNSITVASAPVALDPPVSSAIASDVAVAYGFSRLVQGYSGDTVRLRRLSDNVEANFTFRSNDGVFLMTPVNIWRSSSDVDVVHFFDQKGGAVNLVASGTVAFVRSDIVKRFGVNYSNQVFSATKTSGSAIITVASTTLMGVGMGISGSGIPTDSAIDSVDSATQITISQNATASETSDITVDNGLLTRSETLGAVGCDLAGAGHLATGTLTFDATTGAEVSLLYSHNLRKISSGMSAIYGGNSANERLFFYGVNANQYMRARAAGGTSNVNVISMRTSTAHTAQDGTQNMAKKQNAQQVASFSVNPSIAEYGEYSSAGLEYKMTTNVPTNGTPEPISAQGLTDISNGTMNNGKLVIGTEITDSGGNVFSTTQRLNGIFGGVVLHKPLTDLNRWLVIKKLHQVGQENSVETVENIKSLFADGILHKNINATTGSVGGFNSASIFNFNLPSMGTTVGTPTFTNQYTIPNVGLIGLRSTDNNDNTYVSNDAVPPSLNGTIVSLNLTENTGNDLTTDFAVHAGTPSSGSTVLTTDEFSFGIARDHNDISVLMRPFDLSQIGTRLLADRTSVFGKLIYDGGNQAMGVYNRTVTSRVMVYNETISGTARTAGNWANQGANSLGLDGAVFAHVAENLCTLAKDNKLTLQIARYQAPAGYNPADNQATRLPFSLQSDNWLFSTQSSIVHHQDGGTAHNKTGGVVHHKSTAKFQSFHGILQSFSGVRVFWAWTPTILTDEQVRKIDINLYKLVA